MPGFKLPIALKSWVSAGRQAVVLATIIGALASCSNVSQTKSAFTPSEGGGGRNMGDLNSRNSGASCTPSGCESTS
jgi:hypothetical protein